MKEFASKDCTAGQLNAMVKLLKQQAGEDAPEKFLRGELLVQPSGVQYVATASAPGEKKFVAWQRIGKLCNRWIHDIDYGSGDAGIARQAFKEVFHDYEEENIPPATVHVYAIPGWNGEHYVVKALKERAKISFVHFFELLERQSHGEEGSLFVGWPDYNVAYVASRNGLLWTVGAMYNRYGKYDDGWQLGAWPYPDMPGPSCKRFLAS